MKPVLYIFPDGYPTFRPDISALWGKYLPRYGISSDIVTVSKLEDGVPPVWGAGESIVYSGRGNALLREVRGLSVELVMLARLFGGRYAAVQVRDKSLISVFALVAARLTKTRFFYWMSFPVDVASGRLAAKLGVRSGFLRYMFLLFRGILGRHVLRTLVLPNADHVFVQSEVMAEEVAAYGVARSRVTSVPMGVDNDLYRDAPKRPTSEGSGRLIAYLGTCDRIRRIDFLLDALTHARLRMPEIKLRIIGDAAEADDRRWLRIEIARRSLTEAVEVTGWLASEAARLSLNEAEVGIALMAPDPLLMSATPTKLVEYMALGLPVVANDHPNQSELLKASGGGICVPFEHKMFGDAIVASLCDRGASGAVGELGRTYVLTHLGYEQIGERLSQVYKRILDDG